MYIVQGSGDDGELNLADPLQAADFALGLIFLAEMVLRVLAFGFVLGPHSYLNVDAWNRLDFAVVLVSTASLVPGSRLPRGIAAFRALRGLRALRGIRYFTEIRAILETLSYAGPLLGNVGFIVVFFCARPARAGGRCLPS